MGMARLSEFVARAPFEAARTTVPLESALFSLLDAIKNLTVITPEIIQEMIDAILEGVSFPLPVTSFIDEDILSEVVDELLKGNPLTEELLEKITLNVLCNLCPPIPTCPDFPSEVAAAIAPDLSIISEPITLGAPTSTTFLKPPTESAIADIESFYQVAAGEVISFPAQIAFVYGVAYYPGGVAVRSFFNKEDAERFRKKIGGVFVITIIK